MPAVVNVAAIQKLNSADTGEKGLNSDLSDKQSDKRKSLEELLRRFLESQGRKARPEPKVTTVALGSGFIIDPRGYVVTDDHVVENAEKVTIVLQDAAEYPARVVGRDPLTDLALLKIDAGHPLSYVRWGDSDSTQIGDWVLAIGNPFGLDNTVSSGIISGRGRDIHSGPYDDYLQIDAAINRGNSGGPTFDLHGNVIGVNTAIYSPNGGSVGIGFAIPANRAKPVLEQLRDRGKVTRGWLGLQIQPVTPQLVQALGLPGTSGALVSRVGAGSPAAVAGFQTGDVILSINGRKIRRMRELPRTVAEMPIGQRAAVTIWRGNAASTLQPVISEMPANPEVAELPAGENYGGRPERRTAAPSLMLDMSSAI
ncbi:MAG: trypsin-like peptidase domain-containing protein [Alphaproteobacteria bacterium]|nr:trypsin-like peptidase domain-containing protein [Alphaproteobacteria bacterium]